MIATADLNTELDYLMQGYLRLRTGVTNALASITTLDSTTFSDFSSRADIAPANALIKSRLVVDTIAPQHFKTLMTKIERHVQVQGGYASLDAFLSALNPTTGTKWQGLQDYRFYDLWQLWKGSGVVPSVHNLYQEVIQGATYANALGTLLVGTGFTAGVTIDSSKYAGGFPYLNCTVFAGSSGLVTVTGTQYNPATRTTTAGKTWTGTVAATGSVALAVGTADADSLIIAVSNISAAGSITAATRIYVEARKPSGRLDVAA